jgi:hypothetical protein
VGVLVSVAGGYALRIPGLAVGKKAWSAEDMSLQQKYAEAAVETLRQAIELGYKDRVVLELAPDLAALRDLPGYRALIEQLPRP